MTQTPFEGMVQPRNLIPFSEIAIDLEALYRGDIIWNPHTSGDRKGRQEKPYSEPVVHSVDLGGREREAPFQWTQTRKNMRIIEMAKSQKVMNYHFSSPRPSLG